MEQQTQFNGTVRRVFFANPDGPWMSGVLQLDDGKEVKFSGKVSAEAGDKLDVTGKWTVHPKYGKQFEVETGVVKMDESPDALVHLLATDKRFEGLGPARARQVVEAALSLSDDGEVASALISYPDDVAARAGVNVDIVKKAATVWGGRKSYFDALALLAGQGWSNAQSIRIADKFGENAPALIQSDPYMLIHKLSRFGFKTVDAVARKMGIAADDPKRLAAGIAFCLDRISENGSTITSRHGLVESALLELRPNTLHGEDKIAETVELLIQAGEIIADEGPDGIEFVASAELAQKEAWVMSTLMGGLTKHVEPVPVSDERAASTINSLNEGQRRTFDGFSHRRFSVMAGGAGVGKTYTISAICDAAEAAGLRVGLCAPTGKAAKRMESSTGREARTIHRLLAPKFDSETGHFFFLHNASCPVEFDLVVVDEVSMVDVRLMHSLLRALPSHCRLLLVGDHHQIPSVGAGAILRDLLAAAHTFPKAVHVLTEVVRQAGVLARNTTAVLDGVVCFEESPSWGVERTEKGHERATAEYASKCVEAVLTSPEPLDPFGRMLDPAWDVQVLAPMRKGPLGTYALNTHLQILRQRMLGNPAPEVQDTASPTRPPKPLVGDRVIWTKNDYELDLFNGTQAIVMGIKKGGAMDLHTEDGRDVTIPASKRVNVEVAYALTIHKSQGSEWPMVVLVCSSAHWIMHDRNLMYTGASRAAEALTIVGDGAGIRHFAQEQRSEKRETLGAFLVRGWKPVTQHLVAQAATDTSALN